MRLLFLGRKDSKILEHLRVGPDDVAVTSDPLSPAAVRGVELIVSHGYRHIVRAEILERVPAINLHIALLPWNRGADPNLWSWIEGTPKGVTIHWMDCGLDTGDIIAQREVVFGDGETLASSYARLQAELLALFCEEWPRIRAGSAGRRPQVGQGTFHRRSDRAGVENLLTAGWDTPVATIRVRH